MILLCLYNPRGILTYKNNKFQAYYIIKLDVICNLLVIRRICALASRWPTACRGAVNIVGCNYVNGV